MKKKFYHNILFITGSEVRKRKQLRNSRRLNLDFGIYILKFRKNLKWVLLAIGCVLGTEILDLFIFCEYE